MSYSIADFEEAVQNFGEQVVAPNIISWERAHKAPREIFQKAAEYGFLGLETSRMMGGYGAYFSDKAKFARQLSHYSMATAFAIINSQNIASRLVQSDTPRHRDELAPQLRQGKLIGCTALTEPHAGSDFAAIATTAIKEEGGWRITGEKAWITNARNADIIMLLSLIHI